jgi:catechol 2,3-dioxygenase-like lactoylglutathione lyase family enzyme
MLLYITLGTNDLVRAQAFYDAVLPTLGIGFQRGDDSELGYGLPGGDVRLWVTRPFDGQAATRGNGSMVALIAPDRAAVNAFHAAALMNGGTDEGVPGLRYRPDFYSCYVRDPDGNKLSAVYNGA